MSEERAERTDYQGLLALMVAGADTQNWSYPYWNVIWLDAIVNALANAPRTGVTPLLAPTVAPTLAISATAGILPGGLSLDVAQTWVDEYGRETEAGPVGDIETSEGIGNPTIAPVLTYTEDGADGFEGGTLNVWYSWVDSSGGETLPSTMGTIELPYLAGGLKSTVLVVLPLSPDDVGCAEAHVYIQHRAGNIVHADTITGASTSVELDGTIEDCARSLPLVNSTGSVNAIDITGIIPAPDAAVKTRFYIRSTGATWADSDQRLCISGADEWDVDTVSYPLVYTGQEGTLVPGFPPQVSQVKAIRPIDLGTETVGTLDQAHLPDEAVLEQELVRSLGEALMSGCAVTAHTPADLGVNVGVGEALLWSGRYVYETSTDLVIPLADPENPRVDIICITDEGELEGPMENAALKGSPAAEPVVPTTPVGYIKLAEVAVGTGVTGIGSGDITDTRWLTKTLVDAILEFRGWQDTHESDELLHFAGSEKADRLLTPEEKTDLTDGGETTLHTHSGLGSSGHPHAVAGLLQTMSWIESVAPVIRKNVDARPQIWRELLAVATMVDEIRAIMARSSRRSFTDADRACTGSTTTDFTIDVIDEGLLVQVDLTVSGTSPDIDFSLYRDASRTQLVKTWAGVTDTTTFRELLDWLNEESPQDGLAYCSVLNNTANEATVTTTLTIKEV